MGEQRVPAPIQWHEGLFLQPHHLQQFTIRQERLLSFHTDAASPFHWGVLRLDFDRAALSGGTMRLTEFEAVFPDGLVVQEHVLGRELERDLTEYEQALRDGATLGVHVAVPKVDRLAVLPEEGSSGVPTRYLVDTNPEPVPDLNTGTGEQAVRRLLVNATIMIGDEDRSGCESIQIAEVRYRADAYRLTDWIAPTLRVTARSPIARVGMEIVQILRERASQIAGAHDTGEEEGRVSGTLENRFQARAVVSSVPVLEGMIQAEAARPYDIYMVLCQLIGELTIAGKSFTPAPISPYAHADPRATFGGLRDRIRALIEEVYPTDYISCPMSPSEEGFQGSFEPDWAEKTIYLAVRNRAQVTREETVGWVDRSTIGSPAGIEGLRLKRVRGAKRVLVENPPAELHVPRGSIVFKLEVGGIRDQLTEERGIAVASGRGGTGAPAEAVLYVKAT